MLKRISIKGFKSIREMDLDLRSINLFIGANGVGKSNFLSFLVMVRYIYIQRLQQYAKTYGADTLLYYGLKTTEAIEGSLDFGNNVYEFTLQPTHQNGLFIEHESSIYKGGHNVFSYNNLDESHIKDSDSYRDAYLRSHLASYVKYHFHDSSAGSPMRMACKIADNEMLKTNGSNLAAYLYFLQEKHPKSLRRIESAVQTIMPAFDRFNLHPDKLDPEQIRLEWIEQDHDDKYFSAADLSDGSLRFIALSALLMQPTLPGIILLDEPELGLHPAAVEMLAGMIHSAAGKGCQLIVSTQSVDLISSFEPEDVIVVDREDGQSVFHRLNSDDLSSWLEDYSLGDLWRKSVVGGQPR